MDKNNYKDGLMGVEELQVVLRDDIDQLTDII